MNINFARPCHPGYYGYDSDRLRYCCKLCHDVVVSLVTNRSEISNVASEEL